MSDSAATNKFPPGTFVINVGLSEERLKTVLAKVLGEETITEPEGTLKEALNKLIKP
ncbi:hypothetical protein GF359_09620, partial [candidate division WOR-3 bacterium]|nr:hypothetical protein [candidate division WOR-3 bacterium]MBD3365457.1 hypothetical protein [candidate division WOR-3 bacterium]